jgi:hypothetical protein
MMPSRCPDELRKRKSNEVIPPTTLPLVLVLVLVLVLDLRPSRRYPITITSTAGAEYEQEWEHVLPRPGRRVARAWADRYNHRRKEHP